MKKALIIVGSIVIVSGIVGFVGYKKGWFSKKPIGDDSGDTGMAVTDAQAQKAKEDAAAAERAKENAMPIVERTKYIASKKAQLNTNRG